MRPRARRSSCNHSTAIKSPHETTVRCGTDTRVRLCHRQRPGLNRHRGLSCSRDTLHHAAFALVLLSNLATRDAFSLAGPVLARPFKLLEALTGLWKILRCCPVLAIVF